MKKLSFYALCAFVVSSLSFTACGGTEDPDKTTDYEEELQIKDSYELKMLLIEQFTTENCGYCPAGATKLKTAINGLEDPSKILWIAHHAGYGTDFLSIKESNFVEAALNGQGAPMMAIARKERWQGDGEMSFNPHTATTPMLEGFLEDDKAASANIVIDHTYDAESRLLMVNVLGVANEPVRVHAILTQDGIASINQSGASGAGNYTHNGAPRYFFTYQQGEEVTIDPETKRFKKTFIYTIPAKIGTVDAVVEDMEIVAFVSKDASIAEARVLNATKVAVIKD